MFTIEGSHSASESRSRTWALHSPRAGRPTLRPMRGRHGRMHGRGGPCTRENEMLLRTQWDPFEDLRSGEDEMAEMSPTLARALGRDGPRQGGAAGGPPHRGAGR